MSSISSMKITVVSAGRWIKRGQHYSRFLQDVATHEELKNIIAKGETSTVKFKRTFRVAEDIANEMIAFSNTKEGMIIIEIDDKSGDILGLDYQDIQRVGSLIASAASDGV